MSPRKRKRRPGRSAKAQRRSIGGQLRDTLGPQDGARIPGGCEHCQAYQKAVPVKEGFWIIRVFHDDWCPFLSEWEVRRRG